MKRVYILMENIKLNNAQPSYYLGDYFKNK